MVAALRRKMTMMIFRLIFQCNDWTAEILGSRQRGTIVISGLGPRSVMTWPNLGIRVSLNNHRTVASTSNAFVRKNHTRKIKNHSTLINCRIFGGILFSSTLSNSNWTNRGTNQSAIHTLGSRFYKTDRYELSIYFGYQLLTAYICRYASVKVYDLITFFEILLHEFGFLIGNSPRNYANLPNWNRRTARVSNRRNFKWRYVHS